MGGKDQVWRAANFAGDNRIDLLHVKIAHRFRRGDHGIGAAHQPALGEAMRQLFSLVDVDFSADHDRNARHHRGESSVQAAREQESVDDVGVQVMERVAQPEYVNGTPQARREAQHIPVEGQRPLDALDGDADMGDDRV